MHRQCIVVQGNIFFAILVCQTASSSSAFLIGHSSTKASSDLLNATSTATASKTTAGKHASNTTAMVSKVKAAKKPADALGNAGAAPRRLQNECHVLLAGHIQWGVEGMCSPPKRIVCMGREGPPPLLVIRGRNRLHQHRNAFFFIFW